MKKPKTGVIINVIDRPKKLSDDATTVAIPQVTITVECDRKPVIYLSNGQPLVRKVGF